MAIRPHFLGFSLKEMVSLIGSKDEKKLSELTEKYNERPYPAPVNLVKSLNEKHKNLYLKIKNEDLQVLRKLVMGKKIQLSDVIHGKADVGFNISLYVIKTLVFIQKDIVYTDEDIDYTTDENVVYYGGELYIYLMEYFEKMLSKLQGEQKKLIEHLWHGRAFFKEYIGDDTHSFLTLWETKSLLEHMEKHPQIWKDNTANFDDDFKRWLTEISQAKKDLFFIIS